jgi:hypothetical protein
MPVISLQGLPSLLSETHLLSLSYCLAGEAARCRGIEVDGGRVRIVPSFGRECLTLGADLLVEVPDLLPRSPKSGAWRTRRVRKHLAGTIQSTILDWFHDYQDLPLLPPSSMVVNIRGYFSWKPWEWARPVTIYYYDYEQPAA